MGDALANRLRYPILMVAPLTLLAAAWAGLLCIGWVLPTAGHGPLMISGSLGTLFGLKCAVALAALGSCTPAPQ